MSGCNYGEKIETWTSSVAEFQIKSPQSRSVESMQQIESAHICMSLADVHWRIDLFYLHMISISLELMWICFFKVPSKKVLVNSQNFTDMKNESNEAKWFL